MSHVETVRSYEAAFAECVGVRNVVSVAYARLGLRFLLEALGLRMGDEVMISALTCRVVVLAIQAAGFKPIYADVAPDSLNMDADSVRARLTSATRAIVFQHTYGTSAGRDSVADVADRSGVPLLEDCAQCLPPARGDTPPEWRGVATFWSHNLRKPLPAGAGGCVATSSESLAAAVRSARDRGPSRPFLQEVQWLAVRTGYASLVRPSTYWPLWRLNRALRGDHRSKSLQQSIHEDVNSLPTRISTRQAQWGLDGIAELPSRRAHAGALAAFYDASLTDVPAIQQLTLTGLESLYYYPVLAASKAKLLDVAERRGLELIAWPLTTPIYPIERARELVQCDYVGGTCPRAESLAASLCGLPLDLHTTQSRARDMAAMLVSLPSPARV